MPLTQEQFQKARASGFSTEQIIEFEKKRTGEQPTQQPQVPQQNQLEQRIAQRPDIYGQAVQGFQQIPSEPALGSALTTVPQTLLQSVGGIAQRGEAAVANPFLEMGAGKGTAMDLPYRMARGIKQGITGERLGELGDVARQAGIPEPISAGLGLLGTGILGGAITKWAGLGQKAQNLTKLETTYGKNIAKNVIKQGSGLSDEAVEHGMNRGWKNILTKENAQNPQKGYNLVLKVKKGLQSFYRGLNTTYGEKLDDIAKSVDLEVPITNIRDNIGFKLRGMGILDDAGNIVRKGINKVENEIIDIYNELKTINTGTVQIKDIVRLKNRLWGEVRKTALQGNQPINSTERIIYDLQREIGNSLKLAGEYLPSDRSILSLDELNGWYSKQRNLFDSANSIFRVFKNDYSTKTAEGVFNRYFNLDMGTKQLLNQLENVLPTKFLNELKDWKIAQDFLIQPSSQGISLYPFRLLAESGKYGLRQALKTGVPSAIGGGTGQIMNRINSNFIPPNILRMITGRNERINNVSQ